MDAEEVRWLLRDEVRASFFPDRETPEEWLALYLTYDKLRLNPTGQREQKYMLYWAQVLAARYQRRRGSS